MGNDTIIQAIGHLESQEIAKFASQMIANNVVVSQPKQVQSDVMTSHNSLQSFHRVLTGLAI